MNASQPKKGLLIYRINRDDVSNTGVIKKLLAQAAAFRKNGLEVDLICLSNEGILKNGRLIHRQTLKSHTWQIYWFYFFAFARLLARLLDFKNYAFIYLRHPFFDPYLVWMLKRAKRVQPNLQTILEINTYPYDTEPKRLLHRFSLWMDQYFRRKAKRYIDAIAQYGIEPEIWGIPTIPLQNGIAIEKIKQSQSIYAPKQLRLIAIGNWSYWHGLDRLLEGLSEYQRKGAPYGTVLLSIVGDGSEKSVYQEMVRKARLEKVVSFFPTTSGAALDELFEAADVGIGTLGIHRKGVALDSSLKHREYAARGIPLLLSGKDLGFPSDLSFVHYVAGNDEAIDFEAMVPFFQNLLLQKDLHLSIRKYAQENLSWEKQLRKVVLWLERSDRRF